MIKFRRVMGISLVLCLLISVAGCGNEKPVSRIENEVFKEMKSSQLIEANNNLSFDIFAAVNKGQTGENIFISPISISEALGMAYNGAGGDTKEAMAKVLGVSEISDTEFNQGHKFLNQSLNQKEGVTINTNNSIWIREDFEVVPKFIDTNIEVFDAYVESLDFSQDNATTTMNKWIEDQTEGLIDKVIEPPIDPLVVMYLINTIYFKGQWDQAFDEAKTKERNFTNYNGVTNLVPMMYRKGEYQYGQTDEYRIIGLPYEENKVTMYLILPEADKNINTFIDEMTLEMWSEMANSMSLYDELPLMMPKFTIEYGTEDIADQLKSLGMEVAFDPLLADFSGMGKDLYINRVLHKAVIEVKEEGTKAAAITAVEMKEESMEVNPAEFIANRPFMFLIVDEENESILFIGKIDQL